jgi:chromate transporter
MLLVDLGLSWARVGLFGFGGGPAMIPLMKAECVDLRGWLREDEFLDALALGNTLPGPIAPKMGVFVGWKLGGPLGAAVALLAVVGPTAAMMLALGGLYLRFRGHPAVGGAMEAVKPVVVGMLIWTAIDLAPSGVRSWPSALLALGAVALLLLKVHPALVMAGALLLGAVAMR